MKTRKFSPKTRERLRRARKVAAWGAIAWGSYELLLAAVIRRQHHRDAYNEASRRAHETNKPLLVIGDPHRGFFNRTLGPDWECGNLCFGERGCAKCPSYQTGDLSVLLPQLPTGSHVVYVAAGVLERTRFLRTAATELQRVSGGDLFIVPFERWSLANWLPGRQQRILAAPPKTSYIEFRPLPWVKGPAKIERLAGLRRVG